MSIILKGRNIEGGPQCLDSSYPPWRMLEPIDITCRRYRGVGDT